MEIEDRAVATVAGALVLAICLLVSGTVVIVLTSLGPWAGLACVLAALYLIASYRIGKAMLDL